MLYNAPNRSGQTIVKHINDSEAKYVTVHANKDIQRLKILLSQFWLVSTKLGQKMSDLAPT